MTPAPPVRALVVFHGNGHGRLTRLLTPGFRHCFVCLLDSRGTWVSLDGRNGIPELRAEAAATFDLAGFYRDRGMTVIEIHGLSRRSPRMPLMLGTCVGATKRVLGLRAPFVFTPRQLYRRLIHLKGAYMEPNCKPHMLSEYPLGYSRLTYETEDAIEAVERDGYFGPAAPVLRVRDIIEVWAEIGTARPVLRSYGVTRADAAGMVVDIAPLARLARPRLRCKAAAPKVARDTGQESAADLAVAVAAED